MVDFVTAASQKEFGTFQHSLYKKARPLSDTLLSYTYKHRYVMQPLLNPPLRSSSRECEIFSNKISVVEAKRCVLSKHKQNVCHSYIE
jgi:hypothetical protein